MEICLECIEFLFNSWDRLCLIFLISLNICCTYGDLDVTFLRAKLAQNGSLYLIVLLRPNCALLIHHVTLDLESRQTSKVLTQENLETIYLTLILFQNLLSKLSLWIELLSRMSEMKCIHNCLIHIAH